jgi:hypothetical protein
VTAITCSKVAELSEKTFAGCLSSHHSSFGLTDIRIPRYSLDDDSILSFDLASELFPVFCLGRPTL